MQSNDNLKNLIMNKILRSNKSKLIQLNLMKKSFGVKKIVNH